MTIPKASMRPGRIHPGNVAPRRAGIVADAQASMRPGRIHPGNFLILQSMPMMAQTVASMRPGRIHPGNRPR